MKYIFDLIFFQSASNRRTNLINKKDQRMESANKESKMKKKKRLDDECKNSERRKRETETRKQKRLDAEYRDRERGRVTKTI